MAPRPFYQTFGFTPQAAVSQITTGGTAVTVVTGPVNGGYIVNPPNAAENLYLDLVGTPGSTDGTAHGTTSALLPGQSYPIPSLAPGIKLKANAATTAHAFTAVVW